MKMNSSWLRAGFLGATAALILAACGGSDDPGSAPDVNPQASLVGRFAVNPGQGVAEIVAFHAESKSVFMTRDNPTNPSSFQRISLRTLSSVPLANATSTSNLESGAVTSVATHVNTTTAPSFTAGGVQALAIAGNLLAVAVQATPKTDLGVIAFYRLDAQGNPTYLKKVTVGSLPDGVAFTPDGSKLIVANEGELDNLINATTSSGIDPEGSISIIAITSGTPADTATTLDFTAFNAGGSRAAELPSGVRIAPSVSVARDLEPEYVSVSADGTKAYVTLQENNAVAVVNLNNNTIERIFAMGYKDHGLTANAIAPSDRVTATVSALKTYSNLLGVYMPDGISTFTVGSTTYFITANEGDDRDDFLPTGQKETARVSSLYLDATAFPNATTTVKLDTELGRLNVFTNLGKNGSGNFEKLYTLGGRSFSIYNAATGAQIFDSGSEIEKRAYETLPASLLTNVQVKDRLDNKGPEPESVIVGVVRGKTLAFVALERSSAIMVYDLSNPAAPKFLQWLQNTSSLTDGDVSPEGLSFVPATQSPTGNALLVVGYEVSGTVAVWELK